jgi:ATP-binding cassette subfamily F protein uup
VLVLDEPTNDLDLETLELLESQLVDYDGTLLVVSHDRAFLNNVVTSTIVFEPGGVREYVGGYDDWQRQRQANEQAAASAPTKEKVAALKQAENAAAPAKAARRRTLKEKLELESLPQKISTLDAEIAQLHDEMARPDFYQQPQPLIVERSTQLKNLDGKLAAAYARWEELEQLAE